MSDLTADFVQATDADVETATHFLSMCDGDLEKAVSLFFDSMNDMPQSPSRNPSPVRPAPRNRLEAEHSMQFEDFAAENSAEEQIPSSDDEPTMMFEYVFLIPNRSPPEDIIFRGSFDYARECAKNDGKLLIVNVYDPREFPCSALNRSLWNDTSECYHLIQAVKAFLKENFIFLYFSHTSAEGKKHLNFYPIQNYPYFAIIDPLTGISILISGERMKVFHYLIEPMDFLGQAIELLDKVQERPTKKRKSSSFDDEDELVAKAIAESMSMQSSIPINDHPSEKKDAFGAIVSRLYENRDANPAELTAIQFKMPDGTRDRVRMLRSDQVRTIYAHLKAKLIDQRFLLTFMRRNLIDSLNLSLSEAGLLNATINVDFD